MNIDEYRALKAEEALEEQQQTDSQEGEQLNAQAQHQPTTGAEEIIQTEEQINQDTQIQEAPPEATREQGSNLPEFVEVNGEQVPLDELKNGFMRQSDYTRKTQELARNKEQIEIAQKYYQAVNNDPELAKRIAEEHNLPYISPSDARVKELEAKYNDLLLQQEISNLESKYDDFDTRAVVQTAYEKNITNLEDAYLLMKAANQKETPAQETIDIEALKEQIRQELLSELKSNTDTTSVIGTGGVATPVTDNEPQLTPAQARVAANMGMSAKEYAKWSKK